MDEEEREKEVARLQSEFNEDIEIERLASELVVDAIVEPALLRHEIAVRFEAVGSRWDRRPAKRHSVIPM